MSTEQLIAATPTFGGEFVTVARLYHYPIKSCAGTALETAILDPRGIRHDRELMIVDAATSKFLTQRELPRMALIAPRIADGALSVAAPGADPLTTPIVTSGPTAPVVVWRDECAAVDQGDEIARWLSAFLGHECRLVRMADDFVRQIDQTHATGPADQVGFADGFPCLLIGQESLDELNSRLDEPLPMDRFRPNIVITGGAPFGEDRVATLRIGGIVFHATKACARCTITTVDQATGETGKEPLRTFATFRRIKRGVIFGQNLVHATTGTISVGDAVEALAAKEPEA